MIKNYYFQHLRTHLFRAACTLAASLSVGGYAQLSGNKTLGSGGDYTSWSALAGDIRSKGLSGNLNVTVTSNLTSTSIVYLRNNSSNPTSSTKKIVIDGKGFTLGSSNNDAALIFDGIDYVTIKDYTIQKTGTSTDQKGIQFMSGANNNTIDDCTIEYTRLTSGSSSTFSGGAYIVFSASATSMSSGSSSTYAGSNNTIQNCLMRTTNSNSPGPTAGIYVYGRSSGYNSNASNNTFKDNKIENFYRYAYYTYYTNGDQFIKNDVSRVNATSRNLYSSPYFVYAGYCYSSSRSTSIDGNNFHDIPYPKATVGISSTTYGIYANRVYGNSTNHLNISNNTMNDIRSDGTVYGVYAYYCYYTDIDKNTIRDWYMNGSSSSFWGIRGYYCYNGLSVDGNVIRDNYNRARATGIEVYYGNQADVTNNIISSNQWGQTYSSYTRPGVTGIYVYRPSSSAHNKINYNTIDSNDMGLYYSYGIFNYYYNGEVSNNRVSHNEIKKTSGSTIGYLYPVYNYYCYNMKCNNNLIANNLGYYGTYNLYCYSFYSGNYKVEVRDNSIIFRGSYSYRFNYTYGIYMYCYYHNNIAVTGNNVDLQGTSCYYAYPAYTYNRNASTAYKNWDYNNYYITGFGTQYWYNPLGNAYGFNAWLNTDFTSPKGETNIKPDYVDPSKNNYATNTFELQNRVPLFNSVLGWNPTKNDIDLEGDSRNLNKHDNGAQENFMNITGTKTDATIAATVCSGHEFGGDITIKNNFADTIYGFNITMMSDRGAKVTQKVTDRILQGIP